MRITLTALALFCSAVLYAQADTFQIKNYKYRTPGFRALQLNLHLSGQANSFTDNGDRKIRSRSLNLGPVEANYYRIRSTDRKFSSSNYYLIANGGFGSNTINGEKNTQNALSAAGGWGTNNQFFRRNNWFFQVNNSLNASLGRTKSGDTSYTNRSNGYTVGDQLTVGFGKGRIEWVQDAQTALFILNDLQQQGLINGTVSGETANAFARLITDINNTRVFDFRRRRIYELTMIDSFIKATGLATTTDIRHYATINDNWAFALNPFRTSGSQWFVRLSPFVYYSTTTNESMTRFSNSENSSGVLHRGIAPEIGFNRSKPVSLKWQHNYGISANYQIAQARYMQSSKFNGTAVEPPDSISKTNTFFANGFYGIGFYPNNRTIVETSFNAGFARIEYGNIPNEAFVNYNASASLSARYFINYRTYLNAYYQLSYNRATLNQATLLANDRDVWSSNLSLSLTHFIF